MFYPMMHYGDSPYPMNPDTMLNRRAKGPCHASLGQRPRIGPPIQPAG
jgi:hypothetical protein